MQVIATAGHVDHGKSALVRALTGTDPDRWEEERRRGLSIDLGFAWMTLPSGEQLAFVDVPGHERFVPNMLAGIGPVPAVLFVVAADEGWRQQSAEHLAALDALGVRHGMLVVSRADLADPGPAMADAARRIASTSLGPVESVAVSAVTGEGLPKLIAALDRLAAGLPAPDPAAPVRLWVDRAFSITGSGTVVTGTLPAGTIRSGDELVLTPSMRPVRVRGIQSLGAAVPAVTGVTRAALNLRGASQDSVSRGMALVQADRWTLTDVIDVRINSVANLEAVFTPEWPAVRFHSSPGPEAGSPSAESGSPGPAADSAGAAVSPADPVAGPADASAGSPAVPALQAAAGSPAVPALQAAAGSTRAVPSGLPRTLTLHAGSAHTIARVRPLGDGGITRLTLSDPLPLHVGDRVLLRDPGAARRSRGRPGSAGPGPARPALAGAVVLDVSPPPLTRRGAAASAARLLASWPDQPTATDLLRRHGLLRASTLLSMGLSQQPAPVHGEWLADPAYWAELTDCLAEALTAHAGRAPLAPGLTLEAARAALRLPDRRLIEALVKPPLTIREGIVYVAVPAGLPGAPSLPAAVRSAVRVIRAELAAAPFAAPDADRLRRLGLDIRSIAAAERAGMLLRISDQIVLAPGADTAAARILAGLPQPFTAAQARQALETTRRVVIPLLEYLDRAGVTERLPDDRRQVRPAST
jgi:selenocysteine-specific elongation factor